MARHPTLAAARPAGPRRTGRSAVTLVVAALLLGGCTTHTNTSAPAEVAIDDADGSPAADATDAPAGGSSSDAAPSQPDPTPTAAAPSGRDDADVEETDELTPPRADDPPGGSTSSPRDDDAPVVQQGPVAGIVDGDTFDLGDGTRVRIAIADTPEVSAGIEACGPEASDFTAGFLAGQTVAIYRPSNAPLFDPFDRLLGEVVRVADGASLNVALVAAGLATVDERFADEDPDLARRLRVAARTADAPECATRPGQAPIPAPQPGSGSDGGVTIELVRQDGPGNDVEVYNDSEYVQLRNDGDTDVDVSGWTIVDLADNSVTIGNGFTIPAGGTFRVHSGAGDDDPRARYHAGRGQAYLNNSGGDTIRLIDRSGAEVDTYSY